MTQPETKKKVLSKKNFWIPPKIPEIDLSEESKDITIDLSEESKDITIDLSEESKDITKDTTEEKPALKKRGRPPKAPKVEVPEDIQKSENCGKTAQRELSILHDESEKVGMDAPRRRGRPPGKESLNFMEDWLKIRKRHYGQLKIIEAFFDPETTDIFNRTGRKGAKTTNAIDISWRYGMENKNSIIHITCPTISQAKDIYWEEKRLQYCDLKDDYMYERYVKECSKYDSSITLISGSIIKLCGTWNIVRGRGIQPDLDIYDEVQDCDPVYISATDANMLAKPNSKRIFQGTPPKKKNHYHEWEERTRLKKGGVCFHFSSYINTALPHIKGELDKKKIELIAAGKEDEWIREYLAEDCFVSEDRILPDITVCDYAETLAMLRSLQTDKLRPFVSIVVTDIFLSYSIGAYITSKERGIQSWILESHMEKGVWNKSYNDIFESISEKTKKYSDYFPRKFDYVVADETKTMVKVLRDMREASKRDKKIKWNISGTNLLREMVKSSMITYTDLAADAGPEFQNYLKGDNILDYPHVCTSTLVANEFYRSPSLSKKQKFVWDQMSPLREAGIICSLPKRKTILRRNW